MESVEPSRPRPGLNSTKSARGSRPFLVVSLSLNLGLLLFFLLVFLKPASQPASAVALHDITTQASGRTLINAKRGTLRAARSAWEQLESTDLEVYAANLRAAGCPPKTMRDILLPMVEEKFEGAESRVSGPTNFWASFSQRQAAATARTEQENVLGHEKDKTLEELLGFAWTSEGLEHVYAGEAAGSIGFLDYERAEKFVCISDRAQKQFSKANLSHRIDRRSAIYQEWRQDVGAVLSPSELEETELREILIICQRRNANFSKAGLSGSELRQLMAFTRESCNPLPSALFAEGDEPLQGPDWDGEQRLNAKVRLLLGDSRFVDYLKSCDASLGRMLTSLERKRFPRSLALTLFAIRQDAMARAQEIRQLPLRRAEKRTHLAALRQRALEQLGALSKGGTNNLLLEINQDWLQEIGNP